MRDQQVQKTEREAPERLPYEPPKAIFVPLKLEERLLKCGATSSLCGLVSCQTNAAS